MEIVKKIRANLPYDLFSSYFQVLFNQLNHLIMKKFLLPLTMFLFFGISCSEKKKRESMEQAVTATLEKNDLNDFIKSNEFELILKSNTLLNAKDINEESSTVVYYKNDKLKPWVSVIFKKGNEIYAIVKGIKVSASKVSSVGKRYLTHMIEYDHFDFSSGSGILSIIDTDANNTFLGKFELINEKVIKSYSERDTFQLNQPTHYCDLNHNGNVTFAECLTCMISACMGNTECRAQCALYNAYNSMCIDAMAISCGYLSIVY